MRCPGCDPSTDDDWFADEAQLRGLHFTHVSGYGDRALLPEIVSGGAALADVDGDGNLDAYFVQGGFNLALGRDGSSAVNELYLNRGDGSFVRSDGARALRRTGATAWASQQETTTAMGTSISM